MKTLHIVCTLIALGGTEKIESNEVESILFLKINRKTNYLTLLVTSYNF